MRQKLKIVWTLPEGTVVADNEKLQEWIALTVASARYQGMSCEVFVDGEKLNVEVEHKPYGGKKGNV